MAEPLPQTARSRSLTGYASATAASALWASLVVFSRFLLATGADPVSIVAVRALLATAILAAVLVWRRRLVPIANLRDLGMFLVFGATVAANYCAYLSGLKYSSTVTTVTLLYTYPAVVLFLDAVVLKEPLVSRDVAALALVLGGSALVSGVLGPGALHATPLGVVSGIAASVTMAAYAILSKIISRRYNSWVTVMYGFGFAACFLWAARGPGAIVAAAGQWLPVHWAAVLAMAVLPTLLGYGLFAYSLGFITAGRASMICASEPVLATLFAWVFWGEVVTAWQAAGGVLVLLGVSVVILRK